MPDGSDEWIDTAHEAINKNKKTMFVYDEDFHKTTQQEEYKMRIQCPNCKEFIWVCLKKEVRSE
ncbi:MAG: hypothetical protein ACTSR3_01000 [Candidatus Helarchaeota archaeon]